jgi:hypothetical protein
VTAAPRLPSERSYLDFYRCDACDQPTELHAIDRGCEWFGLSPLVAWALVTALEIQGDHWASVPDDLDVPPCARRLVHDDVACERMKASAHYLADQLSAGRADAFVARCTADEVNLAMALSDVSWIGQGGAVPVPSELRGASVLGLEYDVESASESLFHDHDVFMLWNPMLDGIENDTETLAKLGTADLHPSRWFEPFNHVTEPIGWL